MSTYYFTHVSRHPILAPKEDARILADVIFETENSTFQALRSILEGLEAVGLTPRDASQLTQLGAILSTAMPQGIDPQKPHWSNDEVKLWVANRR